MHLDFCEQPDGVVPHLDGGGQLACDCDAQGDAVGQRGEDATQDDAPAQGVRHDGRHDDPDGREEVGGAVEVPQRADLLRELHLFPESTRHRKQTHTR